MFACCLRPLSLLLFSPILAALTPDFVDIPEAVAEMPYQQCPDVDVMGIRLGQNIATLAQQYQLIFDYNSKRGAHSVRNTVGNMRFPHRDKPEDILQTPLSNFPVTVYSEKFDVLRRQSLDQSYVYTFSDDQYEQVQQATKQAGRHNLMAAFYLQAPQSFRTKRIRELAEVITDVNGDIAAIHVDRVIPKKINMEEVQQQLSDKYGDANQTVKGDDGQLQYTLSWSVRYLGRHGYYGERSQISYRLQCDTVLQASLQKHDEIMADVDRQLEEMVKHTHLPAGR